jgi:flagellar biosynthesis/type III secretory pathway protein FliH
MTSITTHTPRPFNLPRLSLAAIVLTLALAAVVASVVGIAAWTIHSGPGITQADVSAAQKTAYASGRDAGYHDGLVQGRSDGRTAGFRAGRIEGFAAGHKVGLVNGFRKGHTAGYSEGYAAGQAAATPVKKTTTTKTATH